MTFAVLCDWPGSSIYHDEIVQGISDYCLKNNISLITLSLGLWGSNKHSDYMRYNLYEILKSNKIDGIISFTGTISVLKTPKKYIEYIKSLTDVPIINLSIELEGEYSVIFDKSKAYKELLEHLFSYHKYIKPVFIAGIKNNNDSNIRLEYLKNTLKKYNIHFVQENIYYGDWWIESGSKAFYKLIKQKPDVFICANDYMALGVYNAAIKEGYHIPEDFAITGYDNISLNDFYDLPICTIKQPFKTMVKKQ